RFINLMERVGLPRLERASQTAATDVRTSATRQGFHSSFIAASLPTSQAVTLGQSPAAGPTPEVVETGGVTTAPAAAAEPVTRKAAFRAGVWIACLVATAVLIVTALVYRLDGRRGTLVHFQSPGIGKLTTTGNITNATISPDGKYIVYAMDEAGKQGLWIRQVAVANSVRLIPASEVEYRGLTFSPDGN